MVEIYILKSVKKIDGCQSFTHVSILIELKDQQKSPVSKNVSLLWNYVNVYSLLDVFKCLCFPMNCLQDSQIFGIMTTNVSKFARGSGIVTRHRLTCDIVTLHRGGKCYCVLGAGHVATIRSHCPRPSLKWPDRIFYESKGHWRGVI